MATTCHLVASVLLEKPSVKLAASASNFVSHRSHDHKTFSSITAPLFYPVNMTPSRRVKKITRASWEADHEQPRTVTSMRIQLEATVTIQNNAMEILRDFVTLRTHKGPNARGGVVLQLISTEIDPRSMKARMSEEAMLEWSAKNIMKMVRIGEGAYIHKVKFDMDYEFGAVGAIFITNNYRHEFFLETIHLEGGIHFPCNSWIQPYQSHSESRVFFPSKALLPKETPLALQEYRQTDLRQLRGDGKGTRKCSDRIYDFDVYNDLGNPDKGLEFARPVMGGKAYPYPRRCRTGRPPTTSDPRAEIVVSENMPMYVPRDETFGEVKRNVMHQGETKAIFKNIIPRLKDTWGSSNVIKCFNEINGLFKEKPAGIFCNPAYEVLRFDPPKIFLRDSSLHLRDDEFARQTLAGLNPLSIERVKDFPPHSKLDPSMYGSQTSALKEEHIVGHLNGMSIQQALERNKLFMLDYHDVFLPFIDHINSLGDQKAYATRTIFVLTEVGTLKPVAIELSLPCSKQVITPPTNATTYWLWQLAKSHVCSNDIAVHQLIHHWLRSHACVEPFIIAAHRQLSVLHPIYKLLDSHMRYTMEINAQAREFLLSAEGIIESLFSLGKYSVEVTSFAYKNWWQFNLEGLPADLIRRGVAVPDQGEEHGLKLLIEDYPYANDGLLIWFAIERLVKTYVNYYYHDEISVQLDTELHEWYNEAIKVGHADLCHATWWPQLTTRVDLSTILTTIIWIVSAHHAALNFGQYSYGAYVPFRPPLMRRLVPHEHDLEYTDFLEDPQGFFLSSLPSLNQIGHYMSILDILSTHSPDEEYLGDRKDLSKWLGDREMLEAFSRFRMDMKSIEIEIKNRNANPSLKNRCGAGVSPYELLMPTSRPGITGRGVPNSVSI